MEATPATAKYLFSPVMAYSAIRPVTRQRLSSSDDGISTPWTESCVNILNRIDSLAPVRSPRWQIEGATLLGTQFYALPLFFRTPLCGVIHVFIPEHSTIEPDFFRADLDLSTSFSSTSSSEVADLGITRHILRVLEYWTDSFPEPGLEEAYRTLPFGSFVLLGNLVADVREVRPRFIATHDLERQMLSTKDLLSMWSDETHLTLPPCIDLNNVQLISQIHDTVSVVRCLDDPHAEKVIFKTQAFDSKYLYHELKVLLTLPIHSNIISAPINLVTTRCRFGNKIVVVGFTLRYYSKGSLASALSTLEANGRLTLPDQIKWASQITNALIHLVEHDGMHTDLRLDNIVLSDADDVILIDHERKGVWHALAAPEVNFLDYLYELAFSTSLPSSVQDHYREVISQYRTCLPPTGKRYENPAKGYNFPFAVLTPNERESAMVYLLGLNLWCLFEGLTTAEPYHGKSSPSEIDESAPKFPEFSHTPSQLRPLIKNCINGCFEHDDKFPIVRRGRYFLPRSYDGGLPSNAQTCDDMEQTLHKLAKQWWLKQLGNMERFLADRTTSLMDVNCGKKFGKPWLGFARPTLKEISRQLNEFRSMSR